MALHIFNKTGAIFEKAKAAISPSDKILLIDDAVYAVLEKNHVLAGQIYVLESACRERGVKVEAPFSGISIEEFTDLVFQEDKNISWY